MGVIGLFPLGIVLLPGERVPLHIFEHRYRELIQECLDEEREFGVLFADDEGVRDIGTCARVVEVTHRFDDGRLHVVVEGGERFRVIQMTEGRSFLTAEVETVVDSPSRPDPDLIAACLDSYRRASEAGGHEPEPMTAREGRLSFSLGSFSFGSSAARFDPLAKQTLLEDTSEENRLRLLTKVFEDMAEEIRAVTAKRIAAGNGHLKRS